jgi:excinuclease ABC subunit C
MTKGQVQNLLKNLPNEPGVYRYYGLDDNLLYVGKAKNLKNRVSQYFQQTRIEEIPRLKSMVEQIERVEYTVVKSEKESLILEANLINSLQPRYNIQLKDDRSYLYVRITKPKNRQEIPNIFLTRRKFDNQSDYFGPYTKRFGIYNILRILRIIFPYCEKKEIDGKPCRYVQLKQCDGICCGSESITNYNSKIEQIKSVLSGNTTPVKNWLKQKINEAVQIQNFELASLWRDRLNMLEDVISNQQIILPQPQNLDIVTLVIEKDPRTLDIGSVFVQTIREGKMINVNNFILAGSFSDLKQEQTETTNDDQNSMISSFLINYYADKPDHPEVLLQMFESSKG